MGEGDVVKPGSGWKHLGGAVYEHSSGVRAHVLGVVRLPDGTHIHGDAWPEYSRLRRMIAINGGNRKRGVLAWARSFVNRFVKAPNQDHRISAKSLVGRVGIEPTTN